MQQPTLRQIFIYLGLLLPALAWPQAQSGSAVALQAKFDAVKSQFDKSAFGRPLVLESSEASGQLSGDIFALIDHPFGQVGAALVKPSVWCDVLMLHLNTQYCAVHEGADGTQVAVSVGRKFEQPLSETQRIDFVWQPPVSIADYLSVRLSADKGPMSTRDYRIEFEATPVLNGKTFIHLAYAYAYGIAARFATQSYLATLGSDKVGFTTKGQDASGQPTLVGGVLGVVERNTVRYYLAIEADLDAPAPKQLPQRLSQWFDSTERYARQLHEMDRSEYIEMKLDEYKRMKPP